MLAARRGRRNPVRLVVAGALVLGAVVWVLVNDPYEGPTCWC